MLNNIIVFMLYNLLIIQVISNVIEFERLQTIFYIVLMSLFFFRIYIVKINKKLILYILLFITIILLGSLFTDISKERVTTDIRYLFRSVLLGIFSFYFFYSYKYSENKLKIFFKIIWFSVTFFVLLQFFFDLGRATHKVTYISYFNEINALSFIYVVSWFSLFLSGSKSVTNVLVTIITFIIGLLLGSKASVLMIIFLLVFYFISIQKKKSSKTRLVINLLLFSSFIISIFFFNTIIDLFFEIIFLSSPEGAAMIHKTERYDLSLVTALLSTRDLRILNLLHHMEYNFSIQEIFFGIGMSNDLLPMIESDFFDILQAFGVFGIMLYFIPLGMLFFYLKSNNILYYSYHNNYIFSLGVFYIAIIMSTLTGHIFISPSAMIIFGAVFGYMFSIRRNCNPPKN